MKKILTILLALYAVFGIATAATLSAEQREVQAFIGRLYAIDSLTFEYREVAGKHNPQRVNREIYPQFFYKDLLNAVKDVHSLNGFVFMRHPSLDNEDLSQITGVNPTKNPKMRQPVVNGERAYVDVYPGEGRTIYFLTKTSEGWRIINTASYSVWPRDDGTCWEPVYLIKPTPEQQALETKECTQYRQSLMLKK